MTASRSDVTRQSKTLSLLVSMPNVIVTSHQAFLTHEALANIAETTLKNLDDYFAGAPLEALMRLYSTDFYRRLEDESTKLWTNSPGNSTSFFAKPLNTPSYVDTLPPGLQGYDAAKAALNKLAVLPPASEEYLKQ